MEVQHRRGRREAIFSSWKTLVRVCSSGCIDMGQVGGERGGGWAGWWGCVWAKTAVMETPPPRPPVCGREESAYDYSAWLLICILFGVPWPHRTVCLQLQIPATNALKHTQHKYINTLLPLSLSLSLTHMQPASVFIALGTREWYALNDKFGSIFSARGIWLSTLMTHLIYSHCKLAMRLQVWNELIFQSSA